MKMRHVLICLMAAVVLAGCASVSPDGLKPGASADDIRAQMGDAAGHLCAARRRQAPGVPRQRRRAPTCSMSMPRAGWSTGCRC